MDIYVHNTLTGRKERFTPAVPGRIGIYVCGVTPYDKTHLGHARPSVVWDVIKKFLRAQGYEVLHVQNFTDVDDKILTRAASEGVAPLVLSSRYIEDYLNVMQGLGVDPADVYPKVSTHIPEIVTMIQQLVEKEHAYASEGSVFFRVKSFPDYGKLSKQQLDMLVEGTRFDVDLDKESPLDFALWKKGKPGELAWDSPWGRGRPGWHIECSAMAHKYLGTSFDFHGGGCDLVFPHHENEIAQSEGATGEPAARYWLHNGLVNMKDEKMSKSTGKFVTLEESLQKHPKELLRFYMLSSHYRSELEYHDGKLEEVAKGWERLNHCVHILRDRARKDRLDAPELQKAEATLLQSIERSRASVFAALADDFNTALAIGSLFTLMREVNGYMNGPGKEHSAGGEYVLTQALEVFEEADRILGIIHQQEAEGLVEPLMQLIMELRQELRRERNYQLADTIRDGLGSLGISIEDTATGSRWVKK